MSHPGNPPRRGHLHFGLLEMATVSQNNYGMWAHPANNRHRYTDIAFWTDLALLLERGKLDMIFFADVLAVSAGYGGSRDVALREGMHVPILDPLLLVPAMAAVTRHLGFAVTVSSTYEPPFAHARRMSTLDHLTGGRVGWNVATSYLPDAARNFGLDQQVEHADRYDIADEYMEVCYKLWEASWDEDAVVRDRAGRTYTDPSKVHPIDHAGRHYRVAGPHLVEPSPQRTPMLFQAGASPRGRDFAARHAEGVFVGGYSIDGVRANAADLRSRAAGFGRDPRALTLMPPCNLVIGRTEGEAAAKAAEYQRFSRAEGYLAHRFGSGMDLTKHPRDASIAAIIAQGGPGSAHMSRYPFPEGVTVGEIIDEAGQLDRRFLYTAGTPSQVADTLEHWAQALDVDGFMLTHMLTPGSMIDFVELLVPELQRRQLYRTEYEGSTLRERFAGVGHPRLPASHPAAQFRA